eukprot:Rhum_TRINITY_DN23012_c0_g1::Rhum_TRINITY_DN23012_c0_g1_i1::g.176854::m.176854
MSAKLSSKGVANRISIPTIGTRGVNATRMFMNRNKAFTHDARTTPLDIDNTSFMSKSMRLASALTKGSGLGKARLVSRYIDAEKDVNIAKTLRLSGRIGKIRNDAYAARTPFVNHIMAEATRREIQTRNTNFRKHSDKLMPDENPYSTGFDYRMGMGTPLTDLLPLLRQKMNSSHLGNQKRERQRAHRRSGGGSAAADTTTRAVVASKEEEDAAGATVAALAERYPTVGDLMWELEQDVHGVKTGGLLDAHGPAFTHVELCCRAIQGQEKMRRYVARSNAQGQLAAAHDTRVYALKGCYSLSRGVRQPPGYSTNTVKDPAAYGPWGWFESDFGTDIKLGTESLEGRSGVAKYRGAGEYQFHLDIKVSKEASGIHGGVRGKLAKPVSRTV